MASQICKYELSNSEIWLVEWIVSILVESSDRYALTINELQTIRLNKGTWPAIMALMGVLKDSGLNFHDHTLNFIKSRFKGLASTFKGKKKQDLPPRPDFLPDHILPASNDLIDVEDIQHAAQALLAMMPEEKIHATEKARDARESRLRDELSSQRSDVKGRHGTKKVIPPSMDNPISGNDRDRAKPCEEIAIYHPDKKQFFHSGTSCWSDNKDGSNIDPESSQHSKLRQDASSQEPIEKPPNFDENVKWNCHAKCWCYEDGMIYYPYAKKFQNPLDGVLSDNQDGRNN